MHQNHKPWYLRDGGTRLAQDKAAITTLFPHLVYDINEETNRVFLNGTITLIEACGIATTIAIRVEFPANYPQQEPRIFEVARRFPHVEDRHFYPDGQCCLWLPLDSRWNADDAHGLCRFLEEASIFFDQQLVYDAHGQHAWPGPQRSHGSAGYREWIQDRLGGDPSLLPIFAPALLSLKTVPFQSNDPCPCGSRKKYKRCHKSSIEQIKQHMGEKLIQAVVGQWYTHLLLENGHRHTQRKHRKIYERTI